MSMSRNLVRDAIFGFAVGDALGLPVEYKSRSVLKNDPVVGMRQNGTHSQPAGTWSDDSSLSFIFMESLCNGYNVKDFCKKLTDFYFRNYWTPHGKLFHLETSTKNAIERLNRGVSPEESGDFEDYATGNGALMRILPLAFDVLEDDVENRYKKIKEISSITHSNQKSVLACFIYIEFCIQLINGNNKLMAYKKMQDKVNEFIRNHEELNKKVIADYDRILKNSISTYYESEIKASCYVIHSLEAVLWSFMKSRSYTECVLKAVNLGEDTDTNAALSGALAAIFYGGDKIPEEWINVLPKKKEIEELAFRYQDTLVQSAQV